MEHLKIQNLNHLTNEISHYGHCISKLRGESFNQKLSSFFNRLKKVIKDSAGDDNSYRKGFLHAHKEILSYTENQELAFDPESLFDNVAMYCFSKYELHSTFYGGYSIQDKGIGDCGYLDCDQSPYPETAMNVGKSDAYAIIFLEIAQALGCEIE